MVPGKQTQAVVGHVGIEVSDLDRSKKFYKALLLGLGFRVTMDTKEGMGFSNQNFSIWVGELRQSRVKREAPTGEEFVVADHLAILVQNKETVVVTTEKRLIFNYRQVCRYVTGGILTNSNVVGDLFQLAVSKLGATTLRNGHVSGTWFSGTALSLSADEARMWMPSQNQPQFFASGLTNTFSICVNPNPFCNRGVAGWNQFGLALNLH
jgi:catechol 2,3-dioxygenase-like lactoylglutathione lyase family enzyme